MHDAAARTHEQFTEKQTHFYLMPHASLTFIYFSPASLGQLICIGSVLKTHNMIHKKKKKEKAKANTLKSADTIFIYQQERVACYASGIYNLRNAM